VLNLAWKGIEAGIGVYAGRSKLIRPSIKQGLGLAMALQEVKEQDILSSFRIRYSYETYAYKRRS
jgi:hypothetical protein